MKKIILLASAVFLLPTMAQAKIHHYRSLETAQRYCRSPVVWLNTKSHIYHVDGTRGFGTTEHGSYVCQAAADSEGDREAANGQ